MSEPIRFRTTVELGGRTATGFEVPADVMERLGPSRRPAVTVTINGHSYASTVGTMGGRRMLPLAAENRTKAGVSAGDEIEVELRADTAPRTVEIPADLEQAMAGRPGVREFFDGLAPTHRKEWVRWVEEAKRPQTRADRVEKTLAALADGRKSR